MMPVSEAAIVTGNINRTTSNQTISTTFENDNSEYSDILIEVVGYQPQTITANLLENQNIPIVALLSGIPINPSISIPRIKDIRVRKTNVTTTPANKTVSIAGIQYIKPRDGELSFQNLGYLLVTLGKIPKEADIPKSIRIGIQADITFDIYQGLGASEFETVARAQPFETWKEEREKDRSPIGLLHAKEITETSVTLDIYNNDLKIIKENLRITKGQTSSTQKDDNSFYQTTSEDLLQKFKIRVDDITKQADNIWLYIERNGIIETRTLQQGQAIYPGSNWKITNIQEQTAQLQANDCKLTRSVLNLNGNTLTINGKRIVIPQGNYPVSKDDTYELIATLEGTECAGAKLAITLQANDKKTYVLKQDITQAGDYIFRQKIPADGVLNDFDITNIQLTPAQQKKATPSTPKSTTITLTPVMVTIQNGNQQRTLTLESGVPNCNRNTITTQQGNVQVTTTVTQPGTYEQDIKKSFDDAVTSFKEVINLFPGYEEKENYAHLAQQQLVTTYERMTQNRIPGGIIENLGAIDDLQAITTDDIQRNVLEIKRRSYEVFAQQCQTPIEVTDGGITVRIIPYYYQKVQDYNALAYFSLDNKNFQAREQEKIPSPAPNEELLIQGIQPNQIVIFHDNATQDIITLQQPYCHGEKDAQGKITKTCLQLKKVEVGKEAHLTILPETEKATTTAQFNLNLPIEKRLTDLPLFAETLDEEINNTEDTIQDLVKIVTNAKKIHEFWSKLCFITFGALWTTSFLSNVVGGGTGSIAREKVNEMWHQRYEQQTTIKDYDQYVFANQNAYEQDLRNAENIIDNALKKETISAELSKAGITVKDPAKKESVGIDPQSDEARDWYFRKKFAEGSNKPSDGFLALQQEVALQAEDTRQQITEDLRKTKYEELKPQTQQQFKTFITERPAYFKDKYKVDVTTVISDDQALAKLYAETHKSYEFTDTFREELQEGYYKDLRTKIDTSVTNTPALQQLQPDQQQAHRESLKRQYAPLSTTNTPAKLRPFPIEVRTDPQGDYITDNGQKYYLQPDKAQGKTGKLLDENKAETKLLYELADNDKVIQERIRDEHTPKATLVTEGRNQGRVERISAGSTLYLETTYNDAGIVTGVKVYERVLANDDLGTADARYIGTLAEAKQYYQEQAKTNSQAKGQLRSLDEANECVGLINKKTAGKELKEGEKVRTGCKLGNYAIQQATKNYGSRCTDFMSPTNCKILFNACDPVICPSTRCNLKGKWQVSNVAETGIIGSTILCAPNWVVLGGDIYTLPVCLTGIVAGLENIQSILESYKQCLITAKVEGKSVGFCDMLRNFYLCDTLWREASAIFNVKNGLLGVVGEAVFGAEGGGEYASFKANFDRSKQTLDYFTKDYAQQVFAGYAGKSLDEMGTEICKAAIYGKGPDIGKFVEEITTPESPPQYTAFFNTKTYSDIKGQGEIQLIYTYQYHIFAGSRAAMTYSVYLRAADINEQPISGYSPITIIRGKTLAAGQFATESKPLIAKEGYNQICIESRSERYGTTVKCGYGKITTDFSVNYLVDEYVTSQVNGKSIDSAADCVPEQRNILQRTPLQNAVTLGLGPLGNSLLNTGIVRKCSYLNPDEGSGDNRWVAIGTCGKDDKGRDLGTCWLYTQNLQGLVKSEDNIDEINKKLDELEVTERADNIQQRGDIVMNTTEAEATNILAENIINNVEKKRLALNDFSLNPYSEKKYQELDESLERASSQNTEVLIRNTDALENIKAIYIKGRYHQQKAELRLWQEQGKKFLTISGTTTNPTLPSTGTAPPVNTPPATTPTPATKPAVDPNKQGTTCSKTALPTNPSANFKPDFYCSSVNDCPATHPVCTAQGKNCGCQNPTTQTWLTTTTPTTPTPAATCIILQDPTKTGFTLFNTRMDLTPSLIKPNRMIYYRLATQNCAGKTIKGTFTHGGQQDTDSIVIASNEFGHLQFLLASTVPPTDNDITLEIQP